MGRSRTVGKETVLPVEFTADAEIGGVLPQGDEKLIQLEDSFQMDVKDEILPFDFHLPGEIFGFVRCKGILQHGQLYERQGGTEFFFKHLSTDFQSFREIFVGLCL